MYCSKCGEQLNQGDKYCKNCGTKISEEDMPVVENNVHDGEEKNVQDVPISEENIKLLENIDKALPVYKTYAEITDQIHNMENEIHKLGQLTLGKIILVGGLSLVSALFLGGFLLLVVIEIFPDNIDIVSFCFLLPFVAGWVIYAKIVANNQGAIRMKKEKLENGLLEYLRNNESDALYYLPEKYQYYTAANYIKECIINKRAKNLTEALNLYEEQLHRWQMEEYQQQIYWINQRQLSMMRFK